MCFARHIDECKPNLGAVDIMLSSREGNMAQPCAKKFWKPGSSLSDGGFRSGCALDFDQIMTQGRVGCADPAYMS
jgi:hypothetical protein